MSSPIEKLKHRKALAARPMKSTLFQSTLASWFIAIFSACVFAASLDEYSAEGAKANAAITEYDFLTPKAGPSIVRSDQEGNIWVALARAGKLAMFREGTFREYKLPENSFPVGMAIDALGQVWYSDIRRNKIGRLDPVSGEVKDFDIPTKDSWPFFIVIDADGTLWFTERMGDKIGRLDPSTGRIVEFSVPTKHCQPAGLTTTPDGQIFFTENSSNKVGHYNPKTGKMVEHDVPTPMTPSPFYGLAGIVSDSVGNIWFAEVDGRLGFISRGQTTIEEIPVPNPASRPAGLITDAWGLIWFTELDGNCISSYNPILREFRRYRIPTGTPDPRPMGPPEATARGDMPVPGATARTSRPFGIAVDLRGRIWFSEQYSHKLGVLNPSAVEVFQPRGVISEPNAAVKVQLRLSRPPHTLQYLIDGEQQPIKNTLNVTRLAPGSHTFTVVAKEAGGQEYLARSTFVMNSTLAMVRPLLDSGAAPAEIRLDLKSELQTRIKTAEQKTRTGETGSAREILRGLIADLYENKSGIAPQFAALLLAHLRHMDLFGTREYQVELTDAPPYLQPSRLEVEVGDIVTWTYKSTDMRLSNKAHTSSREIIARNGAFNSHPLKPGSAWSYAFNREGGYEYLSTSQLGISGTVIVNPRTAYFREFSLPGPDRVPGVLAIDTQDNIWFTEGGGGFSRLAAVPLNNRIGKLSPDGKVTEYETPTIESGPTSIHVGKEGHIWFTERSGNNVGELDPRTGAIKEYPIPTPLSGATGITVDHQGKIWIAEKLSSKIAVLDPATSKITEYETPTPKSQPSTITVDAAGIVWFDERANDRIVSFDPQSKEMREYLVPTPGSRVVGLVPDGRGHVWFLELGGNKVGRLDVETGMVVEYAVPTKYCSPFKLAIDSFGRVWFTQAFGNNIGVLRDGKFFEFAIPTKDSMPGGIGIDSKGNVWFTEQAGNKLGMIPGAAALQAPVQLNEVP